MWHMLTWGAGGNCARTAGGALIMPFVLIAILSWVFGLLALYIGGIMVQQGRWVALGAYLVGMACVFA